MKKILLGIAVLMLMFSIGYADNIQAIQIANGGYFNLEKGQTAVLQFKGFTDRKIILVSLEEDVVTLKTVDDLCSFFKEGEQLDISKKMVQLKVGEEARSHETIEMLVIIKLEKIENNKAIFKINYHSAPPAPKISPKQKITIQAYK